jgi:type III secretion system YscI/HrpB-like protein
MSIPISGAYPSTAPQTAMPRDPEPVAATTDDEPSPFEKVLRGLGDQMDKGEKVMAAANHALTHQALGPADLLRIQGEVSKYSMTVEVTAHVVGAAVNGVKTVLQGQ